MEIKTLAHTSIATITAAFNEAFRGYFVPLEFTEQSMAAKIKSEGIQLPYSVGAFEDGKLIGFIIHGYDEINSEKTIYNGGTGVIASHRGKGITSLLYQFAIPLLKEEGIYRHVLEVIDNNAPATHIYKNLGFKEVRKLAVYKGVIKPKASDAFIIKELDKIPAEMVPLFDVEPAWQNSISSVERDKAAHKIAGIFLEDVLAGFGSFVAATGRVRNFFVLPEYRRKGAGTALLQYMQQAISATQLLITNVDDSYLPAKAFLNALNFQKFLGLYEMKLQLR